MAVKKNNAKFCTNLIPYQTTSFAILYIKKCLVHTPLFFPSEKKTGFLFRKIPQFQALSKNPA